MHSNGRNDLHNEQFSLIQITDRATFENLKNNSFDCGNDDLNDFFQTDSYAHSKELLATTYYFQPSLLAKKDIFFPVALISLLNDRIEITKDERKGDKKDLYKSIPFPKRNYSSFPAVKIGRLGVLKEFQGNDIGTALLNMIKALFLDNNRTGCRYLTVDAYNDPKTIHFYINKNGFLPLWEKDKDDPYSRILYFDLKTYQI